MLANVQRDGRPAEYRLRPLFNAAKFGWRPLLEYRAVTQPRRETRWNLQGCPKLANRSQLLVGRSSPYDEDMWRRYCCWASFFPIVNTCLSCEYMARQRCAMVPRWRFFRPVFSAYRVKYISVLHSKFVLRPHRVCGSMVDIQSATAETVRGKKKIEEDGWNHRTKIWCPHLLHRAAIISYIWKVGKKLQIVQYTMPVQTFKTKWNGLYPKCVYWIHCIFP